MTFDLDRCDYGILARVLREALEGDPKRYQIGNQVLTADRDWLESRICKMLEDFFDIHEAELTAEEAQAYFEAQRADYADFRNKRRKEDALLEKR